MLSSLLNKWMCPCSAVPIRLFPLLADRGHPVLGLGSKCPVLSSATNPWSLPFWCLLSYFWFLFLDSLLFSWKLCTSNKSWSIPRTFLLKKFTFYYATCWLCIVLQADSDKYVLCILIQTTDNKCRRDKVSSKYRTLHCSSRELSPNCFPSI